MTEFLTLFRKSQCMLQYRNDIILSFDLVYAEPILCEEELRIHGKSGVCLTEDMD